MINSFLKFIPATTLADISLANVERWISLGTSQVGWSPVTSRGRIKYMIVFVKWLVQRGKLEANPLEGISIPRVPKKIPKRLSCEQAEELLRFVRNYPFDTKFEKARGYAIIATFIFTGIRRRELLELELCDVDLENGIISIRRGKGGKDRIIPISPPLTQILQDYLCQRKIPKYEKLPYFFVGAKAWGKMGKVVIRRLFKKIRLASGIYFAAHLLRHTFATLMLEGGCDIFSLSKMMGHADIKTTTIYLAATVGHLKKEVLKHPVCV